MKNNISLGARTSVGLFPKAPFNFNASTHKPSHFPNQLTLHENNKCWQTLRLGGEIFGIKMENIGGINSPRIKLIIFSGPGLTKEKIESIKREMAWRYCLDADLSEFNEKFKKDKSLGPVLRRWRGMRASCAYSLYELLVVGIVLQNATVRRSVQMLNALLEKYGTAVEFDGKELYSMWLPGQLANAGEQQLRNLKVGYRARFLVRLSKDFAGNKIDEAGLRSLPKEEARKELMGLFGVGPETARILLFEALHHYDVFDHIAPWQQKIYSRLFYNKALVPAQKIRNDILKRYGRWSMLAVHYIWEDIFWRRKTENIGWLEKEIRL